MSKKFIITIYCLCFVCISFTVQAKEYATDYIFFKHSFWENATKEDVQKAIKKGYDINSIYRWQRDEGMSDAYEWASLLGFALGLHAKPDVIELLVKNGAALDGDMVQNVSSFDALKKLIELGANINELNGHNETFLHAIYTMDLEMAKLLFQHGALPNIKNSSGETPISIMMDNESPDNEEWNAKMDLLKKAGATFDNGKYPWELGLPKYAVKKNTLKKYTRAHNYNNENFWRVASLKDVQQNFIPGEALTTAEIQKGSHSILAYPAQLSSKLDIIEFLLKKGAIVDEVTLLRASSNPNEKILALLLKHADDAKINSDVYKKAALIAYNAGLTKNLEILFKKSPEVSELDPIKEGRHKGNPLGAGFHMGYPSEWRKDREEAAKLFKGYKDKGK